MILCYRICNIPAVPNAVDGMQMEGTPQTERKESTQQTRTRIAKKEKKLNQMRRRLSFASDRTLLSVKVGNFLIHSKMVTLRMNCEHICCFGVPDPRHSEKKAY